MAPNNAPAEGLCFSPVSDCLPRPFLDTIAAHRKTCPELRWFDGIPEKRLRLTRAMSATFQLPVAEEGKASGCTKSTGIGSLDSVFGESDVKSMESMTSFSEYLNNMKSA